MPLNLEKYAVVGQKPATTEMTSLIITLCHTKTHYYINNQHNRSFKNSYKLHLTIETTNMSCSTKTRERIGGLSRGGGG